MTVLTDFIALMPILWATTPGAGPRWSDEANRGARDLWRHHVRRPYAGADPRILHTLQEIRTVEGITPRAGCIGTQSGVAE